ncbi:LOW QUALITY PROTEIN: uncharacterized protein LOC116516769 [Thamnophis elegans]|uniref:LOW QUALITY PROTEIN: uncharacterized protein LOC116516769 n=1 Tax=Thamnophis elegans TaxID=35005 RepID=UPI001377394C|nr:LOW QUALITY PROTEIN: uncharacterized protein LOC116516769 [Thamnophis elegans]
MAQPFLFLLFLLSFFTGSLAQFTLTQPPSVSVSPGGTVRITCTRAGGSFSDYYVSWHQQKPGTKPLAVIYEDSKRPSGIPERFSGSVDVSSNTATLTISNVQPEDEADYYCLSLDGNNQCTKPGTHPLPIIYKHSMRTSGIPQRFSGSYDSASNSATLTISNVLPEDEAVYYCSLAQFTMTQPASLSASPGGTVRITCTRAGGNINSYYVSWYQQTPGTKPVLVIYEFSKRPSGIPERFSGSYDSSANSATLTITNVQPEDEADYYCLSYDGNWVHSDSTLWGTVTKTRRRGGEEGSGKSTWFREGLRPLSSPTMIQGLLLSIVLISVGPSLQQLQTLKDAEFVAAGGTVTISCQYDGGNLGDGHYPMWTQEIAGHQHRGLISYTTYRPSGVPEHFSGSRSRNMMSLTITGALVEDEATYYCCVCAGK